jgi:CDP-diacylglycerol--serine O-phosphatidyltransferase
MIMLGFYNYTVILTYIGMLTGLYGITQVMASNRMAALICLMVAGVCDMFDGKVASTRQRTKSEKRFGIQIDSLSDLICFGVLPAFIVYEAYKGVLRFVPSGLYVLCALIRLAWFNVDEEERQEKDAKSRKVYRGLPVTLSAAIIPIVMGICTRLNLDAGIVGACTLVIMAIAFITPFKLQKPKFSTMIIMLIIGLIGVCALLFL